MTGWLRTIFADDDPFPSEDPDVWMFAVLPDTQIYTAKYPALFEAQTRWITENAEALRIRFVLHEGDVVNDNLAAQWDVAERALRALDGRVPYVIALGNHDCGPRGCSSDRSSLFTERFPFEELASRPSFVESFEEGRADNSAHLFDTPSGPWLVVVLEFGPRDPVVEWAGEVLARHRATPAILLTHAYTYYDDTRYDRAARPDQTWSPHEYGVARLPGGVNDGEALYQKLVRRHDNVQLVLSGHVLGRGNACITSPQDGGSEVHQLLANYQHRSRGGDGYLRLIEIDARIRRIRVRTFSPDLNRYRPDPGDTIDLVLPMIGPEGPPPAAGET